MFLQRLFIQMRKIILLFCLLRVLLPSIAQKIDIKQSLIQSFKPEFSDTLKYIDLDNDGDPDLIQSSILDSIPIYWIDDDDDMKFTDREGDMDNDCFLIDRNRDDLFAGPGDLSIDWIDSNNDGIADIQVVVENSNSHTSNSWDWQSNYMWIIDKEQDDQFHHINWKELVLRCWEHSGTSNFFEDYHGQTLFLKTHIPSYRFSDLRYSWENPFLFYDPDGDGLTEKTIRLEDNCKFKRDTTNNQSKVDTYPTGKIDRAFLSFDLDNDNGPSNEFDLDMTLYFWGEGFSYEDQVHQFKNMRGLPEAESLFYDNRWKKLNKLFYADHDSAWNLIFNRGQWCQCWFVFDEDDDCERWERVELYQPKNPFIIGMNNGGLDNNPQADASGDRGEWDMDNSGKGKLYIGIDSKIHLFGAEKGYWRIDQNAAFYQGWGGLYEGKYKRNQTEPVKFPTIAYEDTDGDGFFNLIRYDLDGDTLFEQSFNLSDYGIHPDYSIIETAAMNASGMSSLFEQSANKSWDQAMRTIEVAKQLNINYKWYAQMLHPKSLNEKYQFSYWLQFYLFTDFCALAEKTKDEKLKKRVIQAYFQQNWDILLR